jgi:hypothetical protein
LPVLSRKGKHAVDERARHALHEAAKRTWGENEAVTLMEYLPPVGWADVATKRDLDQLEAQLTDRFTGAIHRAESSLLRWMVGTMLTGIGVAFAAARFA